MATVDGLTKTRMLAIEAESVTSGLVDVNGHLILSTHGGSQIDAGSVKGPQGDAGPMNPNAADLTDVSLQTFAGPVTAKGVGSNATAATGRYVGSTVGTPTYSSPQAGDFANDPTNHCFWEYNGTAWVQIGGYTIPWTAFPYASSWSDYSASFTPARYRKTAGGDVELEGLAGGAVSVAANGAATIGTLPASCCPLKEKLFTVLSTVNASNGSTLGGANRLTLTTAGVLSIQNGNATTASPNPIWVSFEGVRFSTL